MARACIGLRECFHRAIVGSSNWPGSFLMFSATMTWNCRYIEGEREARVCFFFFPLSFHSNQMCLCSSINSRENLFVLVLLICTYYRMGTHTFSSSVFNFLKKIFSYDSVYDTCVYTRSWICLCVTNKWKQYLFRARCPRRRRRRLRRRRARC